MEDAVSFYQKRLLEHDDNSPGITLAKFFGELFSVQISTQTIVMCNKLIKLYGRQMVFEAIQSAYESGADPTKSIYGYLSAICKNKTTKKFTGLSTPFDTESLAKHIEQAEKRKLVIRSPFDD